MANLTGIDICVGFNATHRKTYIATITGNTVSSGSTFTPPTTGQLYPIGVTIATTLLLLILTTISK